MLQASAEGLSVGRSSGLRLPLRALALFLLGITEKNMRTVFSFPLPLSPLIAPYGYLLLEGASTTLFMPTPYGLTHPPPFPGPGH